MPELTVKTMMIEAKSDPLISRFLPDNTGNKALNRTFLFNIINSLKPDYLSINMRAVIEQKNEEHALRK
jgi:hypothetical protein